jgi:hypothetical protein
MGIGKIEIKEDNILVVEGYDDERLFAKLIKKLNLLNIQIINTKGVDNIKPYIDAISKLPNFNRVISLGIERDSNGNPNDAFMCVCNALQFANLPVPRRPLEYSDGNPRVIVFISPGRNRQGSLEDLCLESVETDPAMPCVEEYFECLKKQNISLTSNISKAKVQVFLASRERVTLRLGEAAEAGIWPLNNKVFEDVRSFLKKIIQ